MERVRSLERQPLVTVPVIDIEAVACEPRSDDDMAAKLTVPAERISIPLWAVTTICSLIIGMVGGAALMGQWRGSIDEKIKSYEDKLTMQKERNTERINDMRTDLARLDTNTSMLLAYIQVVQTKAIEFGLRLPPTPRLKSRSEVAPMIKDSENDKEDNDKQSQSDRLECGPAFDWLRPRLGSTFDFGNDIFADCPRRDRVSGVQDHNLFGPSSVRVTNDLRAIPVADGSSQRSRAAPALSKDRD